MSRFLKKWKVIGERSKEYGGWAKSFINKCHTISINCTIARYGYVWNVHRMSIKIEHRNLETRKILVDFFVQVQNFLLPLSLKVLRHKEKEAQSFYSGFFICPRPTRVTPAIKVSASKWKPTVFFRSRAQLYSLAWNSPNPPRASGAWRHPHSVTPFLISGFCDISVWHVRSARAHEHLF